MKEGQSTKCILWLWGHLPVLALTDDDLFLKTNMHSKNRRISLLNLHFGDIQIQIISLSLGVKIDFSFIRINRINNNLSFKLSKEKKDDLEIKYRQHLDELDIKNIQVEQRALERQLSIHFDRKNGSISKIDILSSLIFVIVPNIVLYFNLFEVFNSTHMSLLIVTKLILIYALINLLCWAFQALSVRGVELCRFADLKNVENKEAEYAWQLYYDWQSIKRASDLAVTYVSYILESIRIVFILVIIIMVISFWDNSNVGIKSKFENYGVYTLNLEELTNVYSEESRDWNEIEKILITDRPKEVIVLCASSDKARVEILVKSFSDTDFMYYYDEEINSVKFVIR